MKMTTHHTDFNKSETAKSPSRKNHVSDKIRVLGLCLGASTVSLVQLEQDGEAP